MGCDYYIVKHWTITTYLDQTIINAINDIEELDYSHFLPEENYGEYYFRIGRHNCNACPCDHSEYEKEAVTKKVIILDKEIEIKEEIYLELRD
jgi:hypothetical protein